MCASGKPSLFTVPHKGRGGGGGGGGDGGGIINPRENFMNSLRRVFSTGTLMKSALANSFHRYSTDNLAQLGMEQQVVHVMLIGSCESDFSLLRARLNSISKRVKQVWHICEVVDETEAVQK